MQLSRETGYSRIGPSHWSDALWYQCLLFQYWKGPVSRDKDFVLEWEEIAGRIPEAFISMFWNEQKGYLADIVNGEYKDWCVRPNMIFVHPRV